MYWNLVLEHFQSWCSKSQELTDICTEEIITLLENYRITEIEPAQYIELYLQGDKISVFTTDNDYICEASSLLLQNEQGFNKLVNNIYSQIRQIFNINNVMVNIISSTLHQ